METMTQKPLGKLYIVTVWNKNTEAPIFRLAKFAKRRSLAVKMATNHYRNLVDDRNRANGNYEASRFEIDPAKHDWSVEVVHDNPTDFPAYFDSSENPYYASPNNPFRVWPEMAKIIASV